jgi:aspartate racemase
MTTTTMKTIGIIGGSTDLATVEYYKLINAKVRERLGGLHTAKIIINSMDFADSAHLVQNDLWEEGGEMLNGMARSLQRAGAEMLLCVSNTWHRTAETFMLGLTIPLLHIVDPTAEAIKAANLSKVALLGTKTTMSSSFLRDRYHTKFGIDVIVPDTEQQDVIDRIIFEELACFVFSETSRQAYLRIIDDLASRGVEGVVLGCTEIPLLIHQDDRPSLPMFDTLRLHAEAAVGMALGR